jgi:hypothetical protein
MTDDYMTVMERGDPEEASQLVLAQNVGDALNKAYPNHPWVIGFQGGGIVVRHLVIAAEVERVIGKGGFASLLPKEKLGTPKEVMKTAVEFGGQLLETFGMKRGAWHGEQPIVPGWKRGQQKDFH